MGGSVAGGMLTAYASTLATSATWACARFVCVRERERASESESKSESKRDLEKLFSGPYVSSLRLIVAYDAKGCYEMCCSTT